MDDPWDFQLRLYVQCGRAHQRTYLLMMPASNTHHLTGSASRM